MRQAFPPLILGNPKILILGTFPSPLSRDKGEYYGNPRNVFWRIIYDTFRIAFDTPNYSEKKKVLFDNRLALWDVIQSCEIEGALDSAIENPIYNFALPEFIKSNRIDTVLFNGNNAYDFYRRGIGPIEKNVLPSTSPANARINYAVKLKIWSEALKGDFKNNLRYTGISFIF